LYGRPSGSVHFPATSAETLSPSATVPVTIISGRRGICVKVATKALISAAFIRPW